MDGEILVEGDRRVKIKRVLVLASLLFCTFLFSNPSIQQLASFPDLQEESVFSVPQLTGAWSNLIKVEKTMSTDQAIPTSKFEDINVSYKLFGIFPIKNSEVKIMPAMNLIPGGQSIGVSLQAKGVMIVGQAPVISSDGKKNFPAKDAGIQIGDILLKVGDKEVHSDQQVANSINEEGQKQGSVVMLIKHQGQLLQKTVNTIFDAETGRFRVGLYVRDEAAGVGTLTFIDPKTLKYGALGHVINDADTNQRIDVANGQVMASTISSIEKGRRGHPGEKIGSFVTNSSFTGNIDANTNAGIFGTLKESLANPFYPKPIPVGWASEVQDGPAKIYTVIHGEKIEEFNINIERVMQNRTDSKNMVIKVTDPRLIELTGGIIQGMSGSPIIQNGKIIGAVTHVFVNDSLRGYGVFIQNMLKDGGLLDQKQAA